MQKPSRFTMLILPVLLALMLALTGCMGMMRYVLTPTPTPTTAPTVAPTPTPTPMPKRTPKPTSEPSLSGFQVGVNDESGYHSDFFRFGFLLPSTWVIYNRSVINEQNQIDAAVSDPEAIQKEMVKKLKAKETMLDFISFSQNDEEYLFVFIVDFSASDEAINSEKKALEYFETSLFAPDNAERKENLEKTVVKLGGVDRPVYRFDAIVNEKHTNGMLFAVKRGTTFALVQMAAEYDGYLDYVLNSFYSLD